MKTSIAILAVTLILASCTDSARGKFGSFGNEADVKCFSGGQQIYQGQSTGKVSTSRSGSIRFVDKNTGQYTILRADCIVRYDQK